MIYYCVDSFSDSTPAAKRIIASEERLFRISDLVFVTSRKLLERAARWNSNVHLFPSGVRFDAFDQFRRNGASSPEELLNLTRPILGYVGGVHQWVDQELVSGIARAHRNYSFVLVGPIQTDVACLRREPNIILLGQRPILIISKIV